MSAIAYYLEDDGIATTGISLVRENTEALQPPRFLWVTFPLGRPLGMPGHASFQHRVIRAALDLLDRDSGPVLEDYPEDVPVTASDQSFVCPVSFERPAGELGTWEARIRREIAALQPWHELSRRRRKRTTVGASGASIDEAVTLVTAPLDGRADAPLNSRSLTLAVEDLKGFYQEAVTAQPGEHPWEGVRRWLWHETELGQTLRALGEFCERHEDPGMRALTRVLIPRYAKGSTEHP